MKQRWTRLASLIEKKGVRHQFVSRMLRSIFLRHHKNADEIHTDTEGNVMAAVYFTPEAIKKMETKRIFAEIQRRTNYAYEQDQP